MVKISGLNSEKIQRWIILVLTLLLGLTLCDFLYIYSNTGATIAESYINMSKLLFNIFLFSFYLLIPTAAVCLLIRPFFDSYEDLKELPLCLTFFLWILSFCYFFPQLKLEVFYGLPYSNPWLLVTTLGMLVGLGLLSFSYVFFWKFNFWRYTVLGLTGCLILLNLITPLMLGNPAEQVIFDTGERPNVFLVVVDALHAKHTSAYGYERPTTPSLKKFSESSQTVKFDQAFSVAPWTRPVMATIFSGLYPPVHNTSKLTNKLPGEINILPELFRNYGYQTLAVSANTNISPYFGFGRGFQSFYSKKRNALGLSPVAQLAKKISLPGTEVTLWDQGFFIKGGQAKDSTWEAEEVNEKATRWLKNHNEKDVPTFAYLHYMEPHSPYAPPEDYLQSRSVSPNYQYEKYKEKYMRQGWPPHKVYPFYEHSKPPADVFRDIVYQYDAEIRYWDEKFSEFLSFLRTKDLYENSLIIVTADHGEEFLQHGHWEHGKSLFNEILHVPLLVKFPEEMKPARQSVDRRVSLLDLKATLANYLNFEEASPGQGISFAGLTGEGDGAGEEYAKREIYAVSDGTRGQNELFTMFKDGYKIHSISNGRQKEWLFYNYNRDYLEQKRLPEDTQRFKRYQSQLKKWISKVRSQGPESEDVELKGEVRKDLKGLGYLE